MQYFSRITFVQLIQLMGNNKSAVLLKKKKKAGAGLCLLLLLPSTWNNAYI